jgi:hypothetical protein
MQLTFQLTAVEFICSISVETSCPHNCYNYRIFVVIENGTFLLSPIYVTRRVHTGNEATRLYSSVFSPDYASICIKVNSNFAKIHLTYLRQRIEILCLRSLVQLVPILTATFSVIVETEITDSLLDAAIYV